MKTKICAGRISSKFGNRIHPVTGAKKFHNGVDIACPIGTPILAPCDLIIVLTYLHETGGKTMIARDPKTNDRYGFCHLSEFKGKIGELKKKGSTIALSGNTGLGTGAHLHLTYSTGGYWKDGIGIGFTFQDPTSKIEFEMP